mgnify:CR=1 FL=1
MKSLSILFIEFESPGNLHGAVVQHSDWRFSNIYSVSFYFEVKTSQVVRELRIDRSRKIVWKVGSFDGNETELKQLNLSSLYVNDMSRYQKRDR